MTADAHAKVRNPWMNETWIAFYSTSWKAASPEKAAAGLPHSEGAASRLGNAKLRDYYRATKAMSERFSKASPDTGISMSKTSAMTLVQPWTK